MNMLDLFDAIPLIGELPLLIQVFALLGVSLAIIFAGGTIADRYMNYNKTLEKMGAGVLVSGLLLGTTTLFFFVFGGIAAIGGSVSDALQREAVPASSIKVDSEWDRERILISCDATKEQGEIELLGKRTATSFEVRAYRMRAGGKDRDLTYPAWFSLSQRNFYRSGPTPSFDFGAIRADGRWHSRRVQGTLSFSRGEYWLIDAGLGVRKEKTEALIQARWLEERCDNRVYSF